MSATSLCTEQRRSGKQWARGDDAWSRMRRLRAVRALSYASLLDAVALPGMDEPCHATRHTPPPTPTPGACMTGPYQRRHPCSHLLPQRRIACTDGARGWACEQTLIDCAAGVR